MATKTEAPLLTSNDLALAEFGCVLAMAWWRTKPVTSYARKEIAKLSMLSLKLGEASQHRNPYDNSEDMPLDWGDDPIYAPLPDPDFAEVAPVDAMRFPVEALPDELRHVMEPAPLVLEEFTEPPPAPVARVGCSDCGSIAPCDCILF